MEEIPMEERNRDKNKVPEDREEKTTNLGGDDDPDDDELLGGDDNTEANPHNTSKTVFDGSNPFAPRKEWDPNERSSTVGDIDLAERSKVLEMMKINIRYNDGPSANIIIDGLVVRYDTKDKQIIGAKFNGKNIIVRKGKEIDYSENARLAYEVNKFKELVRVAKIEHHNTFIAQIEELIGTQEELGTTSSRMAADSVAENSAEKLDEVISEKTDEIHNNENLTENERSEMVNITKKELSEIRGSLIPAGPTDEDKIGALEVQRDHWKDEANKVMAGEKENYEIRAVLYKTAADICDLKADNIRLKNNQRVLSQEALNIIEEEVENNDLTRFQRFKEWSKENLGTISVVAISIAGIITTIVMGARSALKAGARAVGSFGKALASVAKTLGPVFSAVLGLVGNILKLGAKGISFLAKNLWILAIAIAYFVYDKYGKRTKGTNKA